jgi:ribosomal protein S18 acetylase RimI-like enzyme
MNYTFEFIEKDTDRYKDIKELIKAKGENTCRKYMDRMIISKGLDGSEFAIVSLIDTSKHSGKRSPRGIKDKYILNGFIVCGHQGINNDILEIKLLCSLEGLNLGNKLIDKVKNYAIEKGYKKIVLNALDEYKLLEWYKKQGFSITNKKYYTKEGIIKAREMEMNI